MLSYAGKAIDLKCTEPLFPEFPEMLFGRQIDGQIFFDATAYIKSKRLSLSVDAFLKKYEGPISDIISTLQLNEDGVCYLNTEGHILIESSLVYLFISFVNPPFLLYIFDRMDELFSNGFAVSDAYLLRKARQRIPTEVLCRDEDETQQLKESWSLTLRKDSFLSINRLLHWLRLTTGMFHLSVQHVLVRLFHTKNSISDIWLLTSLLKMMIWES